METQVVTLECQNLRELEVIERLADSIGIQAFETDVLRLAGLHAIDPDETVQVIRAQTHPSLIGVSEPVFQAMRLACRLLVEREPTLLNLPAFRSRDDLQTALPWTLWLTLVRHARSVFDPAGLDADFLMAKLREGRSAQEAFNALIAFKRANRRVAVDAEHPK